jgi:hypothetical protein
VREGWGINRMEEERDGGGFRLRWARRVCVWPKDGVENGGEEGRRIVAFSEVDEEKISCLVEGFEA